MKKVLVTGAAGFIGWHLADSLSQDSIEVICVDNLSRGKKDEAVSKLQERPNVTWLELDLSDKESLSRLPNDINEIFHLATLNGTQNFYDYPYEVIRSASIPTLNILEYVRKNGCDKLFYAGTSEVYAAIPAELRRYPTPEDTYVGFDDIRNIRWSYASGKLFSEVLIISYASQYGLNWNIGRLHNIYGPRMGDKHLIPDFIQRMRLKIYEVYGGRNTRSFLYIDDCISQIRAIQSSHNVSEEIVNVGSTEEVEVVEVAREMMKICNIDEEIKIFDAPLGSADRRCPDMSKSVSFFGLRQQVTLIEGLKRTVQWYAPELLE